ncbi:MAG TPA: potassium channel family protein [Dehalococcoidia bacterium]|nr:potassium channel family protein [Dehalococcoidia bacterium]
MIALVLVFRRLFRTFRRGLHDPEFHVLGLAVVATLLVGTVFYTLHEGWSVIDSLYFCVCTLTTIGYGDFAPTTELSRVFTIFYVFIGIGLIASFITLVASYRGDEVHERERHTRQ